MSRQALALLTKLNAECDNAEQLGQASIEAFRSHPDHAIITSFPGLGELIGARILGELGDDRARFADARAVKAYAGSAPVTRASGRNPVIIRRQVKDNRLAAVGFVWAFATMARTGPPKDHYDQRRAHGDRHAAALRHLFNRMIGQLHHCLQIRRPYDPIKAFPERAPQPQPSEIGGLAARARPCRAEGWGARYSVPPWPHPSGPAAVSARREEITTPQHCPEAAPGAGSARS
jgi:hypothetical protein